jgi:LysM repeat protein
MAALIFMGLAAASLLFPTTVSGQGVIPTPTAGPDGRIIYVAEANDSWWIIAVKNNLTQDQLLTLNNAKASDPITAGQQILIGTVTPNTPTPTLDPNVTPSPTPVTPTPLPGNGNICVVLYNDEDGNSVRADTESAIADGAVSLIAATGKPSLTGSTKGGSDQLCFKDLPEGSYNVSVAVPQGYNATTTMSYTVALKAGDNSVLNFGAQPTANTQKQTKPSEGGRSPIMGLVGGVFIIGAAGLIVYLVKFRK